MADAAATAGLIFLALGAALAGLLFVPMDFAISASTSGGARVGFRWLFVHVWSGGGTRAKPRPAKKPPSRRRPLFRDARTARRLLAIDGLASAFARLLHDVPQSFRWLQGRIAMRAGLGDPAATGELCGLLGSALVFVPTGPEFRFDFEPDFAEDVLDVDADAAVRLVPAKALAAFARFAVSRPGWTAIWRILWHPGR